MARSDHIAEWLNTYFDYIRRYLLPLHTSTYETECEAFNTTLACATLLFPPKTGYDLQSIASRGRCSEVSAFLHLDTSGEVIRFQHHCKT
jgi:hypothetical protein